MHLKEPETIAQRRPAEPESEIAKPLAADQSLSLDPMALEAITFNLEASLRVYTDHHFFGWTQGLLQNLIRHEVLICALRKGETELSEVESFSTSHAEPKLFSHLYRQDASLAGKLIKEWEEHHFQPVIHDAENEKAYADSVLTHELNRIGANKIIAHGTHDTSARMASFFVFACRTNDATARQAHLVEMLVPFLHAAWVRTKISLSVEIGESNTHSGSRDLLTVREQEVLKWVYLGKSNIEIGIILGISPLTVKNHVQEILRRLNVQNRTQAVGKAFNLHILSC
ncbi:MAG: hypothetical protein A2045_14255 [Rhodocyclales bacterium GWA2_65_20]|nr:MAG: hypothetical protein A2045_14255 [Rhodocyclales bacterium GWA2_65_20]